MAVASYRGDHITVDLLWTAVSPPAQRAMDVFSALVTLVAMGAFTWMFAEKVIGTRADHVGTFDLRQPVWIYYFIAWIGLAAAVLLLVLRTVRLVFWPEKLVAAATSQRSNETAEVNSDEHRRRRRHRISLAVRADAAARAGRHRHGHRSACSASAT